MIDTPPRYRRSPVHAMIHHSPTPPPPPLASDDIAICRAWIDAEMNHPGDQATIVALVETAIRRCRDRRAGRIGTHYERIPAAIRPLVGRRDGEGLKSLIGRWERDERDRQSAGRAHFVPGLADLTSAEAEVYWWEVRGWQVWEMQRERTAPRARFSRELWVSADAVMQDLEAARAKVSRMFGL